MPTRVQVLHPAGDVNEDAKAQAQAHGKGLVMQQVVERPMLRARAPGPRHFHVGAVQGAWAAASPTGPKDF